MNTATAIMQQESRSALKAAMYRMFHDLRRFVRVYAITKEEQEKLPELDIVWTTDIGGDGPEAIIQKAIKSCPEMWADALPAECCIVPRAMLRKMMSEEQASVLETYGRALVGNAAAQALYADRA